MSAQHTVHISRDYGVTRVIVLGVSPEKQNNVIVQERVGDEWVDRGSYNSLSNDYAYTSAGDEAERIAKRIKYALLAEQRPERRCGPIAGSMDYRTESK